MRGRYLLRPRAASPRSRQGRRHRAAVRGGEPSCSKPSSPEQSGGLGAAGTAPLLGQRQHRCGEMLSRARSRRLNKEGSFSASAAESPGAAPMGTAPGLLRRRLHRDAGAAGDAGHLVEPRDGGSGRFFGGSLEPESLLFQHTKRRSFALTRGDARS